MVVTAKIWEKTQANNYVSSYFPALHHLQGTLEAHHARMLNFLEPIRFLSDDKWVHT